MKVKHLLIFLLAVFLVCKQKFSFIKFKYVYCNIFTAANEGLENDFSLSNFMPVDPPAGHYLGETSTKAAATKQPALVKNPDETKKLLHVLG